MYIHMYVYIEIRICTYIYMYMRMSVNTCSTSPSIVSLLGRGPCTLDTDVHVRGIGEPGHKQVTQRRQPCKACDWSLGLFLSLFAFSCSELSICLSHSQKHDRRVRNFLTACRQRPSNLNSTRATDCGHRGLTVWPPDGFFPMSP